jgi:hypothetical protein
MVQAISPWKEQLVRSQEKEQWQGDETAPG